MATFTARGIKYTGCTYTYGDGHDYYCKTSGGTVITDKDTLYNNWETAKRYITFKLDGNSYTDGQYKWYVTSAGKGGSGPVKVNTTYYVTFIDPGADYPISVSTLSTNGTATTGWISNSVFLKGCTHQLQLRYYPNGGSANNTSYPLSSGYYNGNYTNNLINVGNIFDPPTGHHAVGGSKAYRVGAADATTYADHGDGKFTTVKNYNGSNQHIKLYANWTPNIATIHYYANGGTAKANSDCASLDSNKRALNSDGDLITTSISYGTPKNVYDVSSLFSPPTGYYTPTTSTNYHSSGWRVGSAGSTTYATQDKYNANNHIKSGNATVKFYARWMPKQLKIIFNKNDGSGDKSTQTVTYGVANQAFGKNTDGTYIWGNTGDFGTWTRTGHTLLGWSTYSSATDKSYVPYCGINDSWIANNAKEDKPLAEINLYAVWKKITYTNTIQHYLQRTPNTNGANNNGWLRLKDANGNNLDTTFTANYGDKVTIPSSHIKTITGHYNTGTAQSEYWSWAHKTIGNDTFTQPEKGITIQYFYNGYQLTVQYKTGKVDIGTNEGTSLTSNELAGTSVFYTHSDSYGNNFNSGKGLMNYNNSDAIYLRKYGFRIPSGSEWKNESKSNTCTQAGDLTTQQIASNLGVSINSSNQTVTVVPNWQGYNLVKVYNGSTWVEAVPMVYDGSSWRETIPQVYKNDTDKWKECGP